MHRRFRLLLFFAVICSTVASAANVSIVPFTGPKPDVPRDQVVRAVCALEKCVPQLRVTSRGRPDWPKIKREKVSVVLMGAVVGPAAKRFLQLEALDGRGRRLWRERLPLARNGKLSRSGVEAITARFADAPDGDPAPPLPRKPDEVAEQKPPVKKAPEDGSLFKTPPPLSSGGDDEEEEEGPAVIADADADADSDVEEEAPAVRRGRPIQPMIVAAAGVAFVHRNFQYTELREPNLRSYETRPMMFAPRLRIEGYPVARILPGIPAGLGLELDYVFAVGLRSIDENDVVHATTVNRLDLAARLNFWPKEGLPLMVAPILGYRGATFDVGPGPEGTELAGLPGIAYSAISFGAEVEYAGLGPIVLFARVQYARLLGVGEIGSDAFFPDYSGGAIEGQGGAGYRILKNLEARVLLHFTRYGMTFRPAEGATYVASGASDQYAGASVMARFTY